MRARREIASIHVHANTDPMSELPPCPKCASDCSYDDGHRFVCPESAHEGSREEVARAVVKVGTKVKHIRLIEGDHDIDSWIDGVGAMRLKSEFVKKSG